MFGAVFFLKHLPRGFKCRLGGAISGARYLVDELFRPTGRVVREDIEDNLRISDICFGDTPVDFSLPVSEFGWIPFEAQAFEIAVL